MTFVKSVLDRAHSLAKRLGARRIEAGHLLKVVYEINRNAVIGLIGDHESEIERAMYAAATGADRPSGVAPELEEVLNGASTEEDLLRRLVAIHALFDGESIPSTPSKASERASEEVAAARSPGAKFDTKLVAAAAAALGITIDDVRVLVTVDLRYIAARVAPGALQAIESEFLEIMASKGESSASPFELIGRLCAEEGGAALARNIALAYVGVAYFCASVDEVVTQAEVDEIDDIRLQLRSRLSQDALGRSAIDDVFEHHFAGLVGLSQVKRELRHRLDFFLVSRLRRERGMPIGEQSLHMAFLGSPGTGKTHVARRFAGALADLGVLASGHLVEVDRSGLIGQHVGHTEKKVTDVIDSAIGGVLFVDEAYALSDGSLNGGYGDEAIDVLVKRLEDDRGDFLAIFAGYQDQMEEFLARNPGLRSRIPGLLAFPDYDIDELTDVAEAMAAENGYHFDDGALETLRQTVESLRERPEFGNARTVRNVFEAAVRQQFARLSPLGDLATDEEQRLLTADDIPIAEDGPARRAIGFQRRIDG